MYDVGTRPVMFIIGNLKAWAAQSDEEVAFGLANLISLCRECHMYVHAHPAYAYEAGYLVHSWDDPEVVKITANLGALKLGSDGSSELEACEECFLLCRDACRDSVHEF